MGFPKPLAIYHYTPKEKMDITETTVFGQRHVPRVIESLLQNTIHEVMEHLSEVLNNHWYLAGLEN